MIRLEPDSIQILNWVFVASVITEGYALHAVASFMAELKTMRIGIALTRSGNGFCLRRESL